MAARTYVCGCTAVTLLWSLTSFCSAQTLKPTDLEGRWQLRIDAGGEIYKGSFTILHQDGRLTGTYESDEGRRTRLTSVTVKGRTVRIETRTQRFSVPVTAIFIADVKNGKMAGEADFSSGARSTSNDFSAILLTQKTKSRPKPESQAKPPSVATRPKADASRERHASVTFRQAKDYRDTTDVEVWAIAPGKPLARQGTLTADGNNGGGESQVLMRFDGIFGDHPKRIPPGARIQSATLRVVAFDPGTTVYVHRLLIPWTAAATWKGLANGITIDNVEASTVRDGFTFGQINMDRQSVEFDVTQTVQHWSDGEKNHGWVFVNTGSNGWDFYSSDWHEEDVRPTLKVKYEVRPKPAKTPTASPAQVSAVRSKADVKE